MGPISQQTDMHLAPTDRAGGRSRRSAVLATALILLMVTIGGAAERVLAKTEAELWRLREMTGGNIDVARSRATGTPSILRFHSGSLSLEGTSTKQRAMSFLENFGGVFGLQDPFRELEPARVRVDTLGMTHLSYRQIYQGIPVFAAELKVHFDATDQMVAVNGTFVPEIRLDPTPKIEPTEAESLSLNFIAKSYGRRVSDLRTVAPDLQVFRTGLIRGIKGANHLAWRIEVSDGMALREFVFVDAHSGIILDRHLGNHDARRVIHHETFGNRIWLEGDSTPYSGLSTDKNDEVNELIDVTGQTHRLFSNISAGDFLSFDGQDSLMHSVYEAEADPPCDESLNAWWDGRSINFCAGLAVDDVIAHEWTHGYTDSTHNLIYQWQPGALNESYSDIFGEIVDLLNGTGLDQPGRTRNDGECSAYFSSPIPSLDISSPASLAGAYATRGASFNPAGPWSVTAAVELVDDGTDTSSDACEPLQAFTAGRIALIDRGECTFVIKTANAQDAGAAGVIITNNAGDDLVTMGGEQPAGYDTPAVFVTQSVGDEFKTFLDDGLTAQLAVIGSTDNSVRWLTAEDGAAGAFRDMWNPVCFGHPGRVSDPAYHCSDSDSGGVHSNSGISNHAFTLVVDGGMYNGRTVSGIGLTRAAHIYWRSMSVYQNPTTVFAEHADLLELSCSDLVGIALTDLTSGESSPEVIDAGHCDQVAQAMLAVEMRETPTQCSFQPVLEPGARPISNTTPVYTEEFNGVASISNWILSNEGVFDEYDSRDWIWTLLLPESGETGALFAIDSATIGDCNRNDQSGVMRAESPSIAIPGSATEIFLIFDHYVATEDRWDGGNLKISVNGDVYQLIPASAFRFNPYNSSIIESATDDDEIETSNTNPLTPEPAFTGTDEGELDGSWGQSQIDLGALASPGDSIRIRFDFGVDGCNGVDGWYIDNFAVLIDAEPTTAVRRGGQRVRAGN